MNTGTKIALGSIGLILIIGVVTAASFMGMYNQCIQYENSIKAQYSQNQNNYDNMWKKFKEAVQVNDMYASGLKETFTSAIQGRYGQNGSKAVFQWIKEHNPNFDSSLYKSLQQMIESGRNSFASDQKMLIDKKQVYETYFATFPNNMVAGAFRFPRIDLAKYDIVTSESTEKAFATKRADEIKFK